MKIRIEVGDIIVRLEDVELTHRQVRNLIRYAVAAAATLPAAQQTEPDEGKQPMGFSASMERLPEEIPKEDITWYFE